MMAAAMNQAGWVIDNTGNLNRDSDCGGAMDSSVVMPSCSGAAAVERIELIAC
jgi:hypothetical protein